MYTHGQIGKKIEKESLEKPDVLLLMQGERETLLKVTGKEIQPIVPSFLSSPFSKELSSTE